MADEHNSSKASPDAQGLFAEFTAPTYDQWYEAAVASLKGAPFEKRVITKTYESIDLKPLYREEDVADLPQIGAMPGFAPYLRGTSVTGYIEKPWEICQEIACPLPEDFNQAACNDLSQGQTGLTMALDTASKKGLDPGDLETTGQGGLSVAVADDIGAALKGIDSGVTGLFVDAGACALPVAALILADEGRKNVTGCIGADPLGVLAREGVLGMSPDAAYGAMAGLTAWASKNAPGLRTILVSGSPYHDAGASATQELGFSIATGVEYIRAMQDRGLQIDEIAPQMVFVFSLGRNFFLEIAKLRAARMLWCQVVKAFGGNEESQKMTIHGRTSAWTKTVFDPYVNMLRNTTEAFAGAMGGVDSMCVAPFDEPIRAADEFSRRVSRNVQVVLQEECRLTRPIDPAGGSYAVETLTDQVAEMAWGIFQGIEEKGGQLAALKEGYPQKAALETSAARFKNLSKRKDVFVGTNMYPNLLEKPLEVPSVDYAGITGKRKDALKAHKASRDAGAVAQALEDIQGGSMESALKAALAGATIEEISKAVGSGADAVTVEKLDTHRGAEPFERLRQAARNHVRDTGETLKVFLANMGPIPQHKPRADFTTGFFEAGGFEVITNAGFGTEEEAAKAALDSGALVVVICSTDKTYPEIVPKLVRLIKEKNSKIKIILAGRPARDQADNYKEAGLDDALYMGADCYKMLSNLQKEGGVNDA